MDLNGLDRTRIAELCAAPDERLEYAVRQVAKRFADELGHPVSASDTLALIANGAVAHLHEVVEPAPAPLPADDDADE